MADRRTRSAPARVSALGVTRSLVNVVEHVRWEGVLCVSPASLAILCRRVGICQAESYGCWSFLAVSKLLFEWGGAAEMGNGGVRSRTVDFWPCAGPGIEDGTVVRET